MNLLALATLVITGFVSGAEFGHGQRGCPEEIRGTDAFMHELCIARRAGAR